MFSKDGYIIPEKKVIPVKEWQSLSDDEIDNLDRWGDLMSPKDMIDFARAIEQALKERNHG